MKKFGIVTSAIKPSDRISLFPIFSFIVKKGDLVVFENFSEVCFQHCEGSLVFDIVKFQESPVGVSNTQIQPRDLLLQRLRAYLRLLNFLHKS